MSLIISMLASAICSLGKSLYSNNNMRIRDTKYTNISINREHNFKETKAYISLYSDIITIVIVVFWCCVCRACYTLFNINNLLLSVIAAFIACIIFNVSCFKYFKNIVEDEQLTYKCLGLAEKYSGDEIRKMFGGWAKAVRAFYDGMYILSGIICTFNSKVYGGLNRVMEKGWVVSIPFMILCISIIMFLIHLYKVCDVKDKYKQNNKGLYRINHTAQDKISVVNTKSGTIELKGNELILIDTERSIKVLDSNFNILLSGKNPDVIVEFATYGTSNKYTV